jgi:hypothetical protein
MFLHRLRVIEGKDGNSLNEGRVLCNSILLNGGKLQVETLPEWSMSAGSSLESREGCKRLASRPETAPYSTCASEL